MPAPKDPKKREFKKRNQTLEEIENFVGDRDQTGRY